MKRCLRCSGEFPVFAVFCPHCTQAHEPNFDQLINLIVDGRYRIYRRLGQGGLSTIFAAADLDTNNVVALKISDPAQLVRREMSYAIAPSQTRDYWDEMLERMRREAETLAEVRHPNIVRYYGTGLLNEDLRYVTMEFLRGRTLRDEIDHGGVIEPPKAIGIALEIVSALSEAHRRGIIHRDINPRNIFICRDGVKLIDFGIAKFPQPPGAPPFTQHSTLAGTVAYASPEQCATHPVDHRSDIYSLGVVIYEMVTGQRPFNGRTPTEIALKQIQTAPAPPRSINPAISTSLEKTILRALAKNPVDRQQSVEEMAWELQKSSNQIVIPLAPLADDQIVMAGPTDKSDLADAELTGNGIAQSHINIDEAESKLKLVKRRRRRFAITTATLLATAAMSALLFGWPSILSKINSQVAADSADSANPASLADNSAISSDADSLELELAANPYSQKNSIASGSTPPVLASPDARQQTRPGNFAVSNTVVKHKSVARTAIPPTPSPVPPPIAPKTLPQTSQAPVIAINRAPLPPIEPDLAQAPVRDHDDGHSSREENGTNNRRSNDEADRDSDRDDDFDSNRRRKQDSWNSRRQPDHMSRKDRNRDEANRSEADRDYRIDDDDDYSARIGPKLIQWSGRVNHEREIKIEMPGVPGTVEIPRAYRNRVGIIEPPSANNNWRCAVLRVFGRGGVSIIVRWWPAARKSLRYTARR